MSEMMSVTRRPPSVTRASQVIWLLLAVATVTTLMAVLRDDDVIAAWVGGQGRSPDDTRVPPSFTPVVVVLYVVISSLLLVLLAFLRGGHNWARHCIAAGVGVVAFVVAAGLRTDPPLEFLVASIVIVVLAGVAAGAALPAVDLGLRGSDPPCAARGRPRPPTRPLSPTPTLTQTPRAARADRGNSVLTHCRRAGVPFGLFERLFDQHRWGRPRPPAPPVPTGATSSCPMSLAEQEVRS